VGESTGRNARRAGILKGKMPSRCERKTLRFTRIGLVKDRGGRARGEEGSGEDFLQGSAEREAREVRKLRRVRVPDPN